MPSEEKIEPESQPEPQPEPVPEENVDDKQGASSFFWPNMQYLFAIMNAL